MGGLRQDCFPCLRGMGGGYVGRSEVLVQYHGMRQACCFRSFIRSCSLALLFAFCFVCVSGFRFVQGGVPLELRKMYL